MLCCDLGDQIQPLTLSQYAKLARLIRSVAPEGDLSRDLSARYLHELGLNEAFSARICRLLSREARLSAVLRGADARGITAVTVLNPAFPQALKLTLSRQCPPVLFCRGALPLTQQPGIALVGARALREPGAAFARTVGQLAAAQHRTLISGNARGADQTAQNACLAAGGAVVSFVADRLSAHAPQERTLFCSEGGFDLGFSAARALSRNRLIHAMAQAVFVAQTACGTGGTWAGTTENLQKGWSPVYVCDDGSDGAQALVARGATAVTAGNLTALPDKSQLSLF